MIKFQVLFLPLLFCVLAPHVKGDATGLTVDSNAGTISTPANTVQIEFDFADLFATASQVLEETYFTVDESTPGSEVCTGTTLSGLTATATEVDGAATTTVTNAIDDIISATSGSTGADDTVFFCVQVTLCDSTVDCSDPLTVVARAVALVSFAYTVDAQGNIDPSSVNAIPVSSDTTALSQAFELFAAIVPSQGDCSTTPTNVVQGAFTGEDYFICLYASDADTIANTQITAITGWSLSTSAPATQTGAGAEIVGSCASTSADSCVTTTAFTLSSDLAPSGGPALAVTGTVDGTLLITDARRGRRELSFAVGYEGPVKEPLVFAVTPTERNDDDCGGFILFLPFCYVWKLILRIFDLLWIF